MSKNFNPNNFDYVEIDPRVMGTSADNYSDYDALDEDYKVDMFGNKMHVDETQLSPSLNLVNKEENLLKEILTELREIKILLAGR